MLQVGESVYTTLQYAGAQSTGKVYHYDDEFEFIPNAMDNLTKGLSAKSDRQVCSFRYDDVSFMKKSGFLFIKMISMKIKLHDGTEERVTLITRQINEVYEFLKTKVAQSAIREK